MMTTDVLAPSEERASPDRQGSRSRQKGRRAGRDGPPSTIRGLLPLVVLLVVWQLVASDASPYFPPPSTWVPALVDLWQGAELLPAVTATLVTVFVSLATATALGTLLGCLVGVSSTADRALGPTFEFLRAIPPAAMVPVATLLLGYDDRMKVTVVTLAAVWAVLLNTRAGVHGLEPVLLESARSLQLNRFERLRKVILPALLPSVFRGIRVAAPIVLVITLLVEIVTQVEGLGSLIATSQRTFRSAQVYGLILVAGMISLMVNAFVTALESYTTRYRPNQ